MNEYILIIALISGSAGVYKIFGTESLTTGVILFYWTAAVIIDMIMIKPLLCFLCTLGNYFTLHLNNQIRL